MTPLQRRATQAYRANDNSRIIRDSSGKITTWTDVLGTGHGPPINPEMVSPETRKQIQDGDTILILPIGAKIIDPVQFAKAVQSAEPETDTLTDLAVSLIATAVMIGTVLALVGFFMPRIQHNPPLAPASIQIRDEPRPYAEFEIDSHGRLINKQPN